MIKFRGKKRKSNESIRRVPRSCGVPEKKELDDLESERISREKREGNIESK